MSLRCGCAADGDEIVFGQHHQCWPEESAHADNLQAEIGNLERPHLVAAVREYLRNHAIPREVQQ